MGFIRHMAKECSIKTGTLAGSFSCIRVFLTGCSPAEPVSAFSDVAKMRINEKIKNNY